MISSTSLLRKNQFYINIKIIELQMVQGDNHRNREKRVHSRLLY